MFHESHARSVAKAISWRVMGSLATAVLVFVFTRRLTLSLAVGGVEFIAKIALFWLHERVWDRVHYGKRQVEPVVVWLTGYSGSGKSTIAEGLATVLQGRGLRVERLDGDTVRNLFPTMGFTRPEREEHIRRVGFLASRLEQNGVFVIASFISPYQASRDFARGLCKRFVEVHVSTPLEVCETRDVKGLYARARRGEIANFTGISDPYEPPARPELAIDTATLPPDDAVRSIVDYLRRTQPDL